MILRLLKDTDAKIVEQYFIKAPDKKKAIYEILNIKNFKDFLDKSGYLNAYLKQ